MTSIVVMLLSKGTKHAKLPKKKIPPCPHLSYFNKYVHARNLNLDFIPLKTLTSISLYFASDFLLCRSLFK